MIGTHEDHGDGLEESMNKWVVTFGVMHKFIYRLVVNLGFMDGTFKVFIGMVLRSERK